MPGHRSVRLPRPTQIPDPFFPTQILVLDLGIFGTFIRLDFSKVVDQANPLNTATWVIHITAGDFNPQTINHSPGSNQITLQFPTLHLVAAEVEYLATGPAITSIDGDVLQPFQLLAPYP